MNIQDMQGLLKAAGYFSKEIDGELISSAKGASVLLRNRADEVRGDWTKWEMYRQLVAAAQLVLKYAGYTEVGTIDGLIGPDTQHAFENYDYFRKTGHPAPKWRDNERSIETRPSPWPFQRDVEKFFGPAGGPACTAGRVIPPFPMVLTWDRKSPVTVIRCHEKVARSAERALQRIYDEYSLDTINRLGFNLFSGCYNYRKMRGGSALSMHSYGIAMDFNDTANQLRWGKDKASFGSPECVPFFEAWEAEGWVSLGRARNYDWMHVQAARLGS